MDKPIISGNRIIAPSNLEYLSDVDVFVEGVIRGWGADESTIADIAISVSELANNAITHGNKGSRDKCVTVEVARENGMVCITVVDQGSGFDPDSVADPLADENLLKEVGRGMFIVRSLMDSVDTEITPQGTTVIIRKAI